MGGMLSDEELAKLASLKDGAFDQLFLASMIAHHEGAPRIGLFARTHFLD